MMDIITIKLKKRKEHLNGILLAENDYFLVINNNPVDYVLDGLLYINKVHIDNYYTKYRKDEFEYKVFQKKGSQSFSEVMTPSFGNFLDMISSLFTKNILIEISLSSDAYLLIGKIIKVNKGSFLMELIGIKGNIIKIENIKYRSVRTIGIFTDYIISITSIFS